jgi:transposase
MNMKNIDYAVLVALDWGDKSHAFARQQADGVMTGQIEATAEGLHAWLEQLHEVCDGRPVALAVEAGRNALLHVLLEYPWLTIYPVHPATSARFRTAFIPSGAKDDVPDSVMLLTLLERHRDRLKPLVLDGPQTRELAGLVLARRRLVEQRTSLTNQLCIRLKAFFPQALMLIGDNLSSPMALAFLRRFSELEVLQKARPSTLRAFYHKHGVRSEERIAKRLELIAQARPLIHDRSIIASALLEVALLLDLLEVHACHLAKLEKRVAEAFAAHPRAALFSSLPGAGPVLAPRLLVAFGDRRDRYPDAEALQKYAGVAPVREKSGQHTRTRWRWHAPSFLRQTFVEWAGQTVLFCDWARAYYFHQKQAGKGHHSILRSLAFKWIRILWKCWHDNIPYDPHRYHVALLRQNSPLAATLAKS